MLKQGPTVIKVAYVIVTLSQTIELGNVGNVEHEPDLVLGLHLAAGGVLEVPAYLLYWVAGTVYLTQPAQWLDAKNLSRSTMEMPLDIHADRVVQGQGQ